MNLSEVLNVALPELPARRIGKEPPRLHPNLIAREQIEDGKPTVIAMVPEGTMMYRFSPEEWKLVQLFNGEHSYSEIAELYAPHAGVVYSEQDLRASTEALAESGFWYMTPLERNITAGQKMAEQRERVKKKVDLSLMSFSTWDPDRYLTRLHQSVGFIYSKWFTLATLGMFVLMALIFMGGWSEIWRDTMQYYNFTTKGAGDIAEFWLLFCGLGFLHESAHGLTCKHFGGGVHRMGFMLIYLSPAFFVEVGEVYVYGGKWQRVATIIAGIWVELMFCSVASVIWWGTPAGSPVHDFAYKIMMITGVAVVLMNLNPLIKLDGYYLFSELIGLPTIKESSTAYLSSWVKKNLFGLPVEVPYVRPRRRWLFVIYALLSDLYGYLLLFAVIMFSYNVFSRYSRQWAFLPALGLAFLIFRARLRAAWRFMRDFYLDKQQSVVAWWTPARTTVAGVALALVLFAPVWRETVSGRFALEPEQSADIRAMVPGEVVEVMADEAMHVKAGAPLLRMRDFKLEADAGHARADLQGAEADARQAMLNYAGVGLAGAQLSSQSERYHSISQQLAALQVSSPISGVIVTPRLRNLLGSFVQDGAKLAEVDDVTTLKARVFIPEFQIRRVALGAPVSLKLDSSFQPLRGNVSSVAPASSEIAPGLVHEKQYEGIAPPSYYLATVLISNPDEIIRPGVSGNAKIAVGRQSLAGLMWKNVREFVQRKIW